jgi:hypothetical protein
VPGVVKSKTRKNSIGVGKPWEKDRASAGIANAYLDGSIMKGTRKKKSPVHTKLIKDAGKKPSDSFTSIYLTRFVKTVGSTIFQS